MLEVLYNRISLNLIASNLVFCIIRICNQSVYLSRVNVRERYVKITFVLFPHMMRPLGAGVHLCGFSVL